jgi:hypothetical protein
MVIADNNHIDETEIVIPAGNNPNHLNYCINDLQPDTIYQLKLKAVNKAGDSSFSEYSEFLEIGIINLWLDALVPAIEFFDVKIVSPCSVMIEISSFTDIKPRINGFKVCWAWDESMNTILGWSDLILTTQSIIDSLPRGASLYFASCLVGEHEGIY